MVELARALFVLLPEKVEGFEDLRARLVGINLHRVANAVGRPEADDGFGGVAFFRNDLREHLLRVGKKLGGLLADDRVLEDLGIAAVEFPGRKKRRPIDERRYFGKVQGTSIK